MPRLFEKVTLNEILLLHKKNSIKRQYHIMMLIKRSFLHCSGVPYGQTPSFLLGSAE